MGLAKKLKRKEAVKVGKEREQELIKRVGQIATENTLTFVFLALRDKFGWGGQRLSKLLDAYNETAKDANDGYMTAFDVRKALYDECKELRDSFVERR